MSTIRLERLAGVILADPPWAYRNWSDAVHGAARAHYDGQAVEDLARVPVAEWAAPDAILAMWATFPMLDQGIRLCETWGFEHVTAIPWVKTVPSSGEIYRGVGFWAMASSELLVLARRGAPKRVPVAERLGEQVIGLLAGEPRVVYAPRGKHSRKPLEVHAWLEAILPGPYLELYATQERTGWTCWGRALGVWLDERGASPCEPVAHDPKARKAERLEPARRG